MKETEFTLSWLRKKIESGCCLHQNICSICGKPTKTRTATGILMCYNCLNTKNSNHSNASTPIIESQEDEDELRKYEDDKKAIETWARTTKI